MIPYLLSFTFLSPLSIPSLGSVTVSPCALMNGDRQAHIPFLSGGAAVVENTVVSEVCTGLYVHTRAHGRRTHHTQAFFNKEETYIKGMFRFIVDLAKSPCPKPCQVSLSPINLSTCQVPSASVLDIVRACEVPRTRAKFAFLVMLVCIFHIRKDNKPFSHMYSSFAFLFL